MAAAPLTQAFGKFLLLILGHWQIEGQLPREPQVVLIAAPHTSGWDVPLGLAAAYATGFVPGWRMGFIAKASLFRGPLRPFLLWLGGIPIDRRQRNHLVEQMIAAYARHPRFCVALTPEGTRQKTNVWKTGFYRIALGARVPIWMVALDYGHRTIRLGPVFWPSGDPRADLACIRPFYAKVVGKHADRFGEINFPAESADPNA